MIELKHGDARAVIEPDVGHMPMWSVGGRSVLHAVPWRDDPEVQAIADMTPCNKRLAGDFFCLPFCADDVAGDPAPHGHPANSPWNVVEQGHAHARLHLSVPVRGAALTKEVRLNDQVLYQTHVIEGGAGDVSLAHHPMAHMAEGGRLSYSPKRAALTDPLPQYAGHNLWALNQIRPDLRLDCEDGTQWDLRNFPSPHAVEDFAILVEARGARLGWTVLVRPAEDDMLVVIKDARVLPVTMLWISNGGRDFAPWNGRHTGVIGIEDGIAAGATGLAYSQSDNPLRGMGVPTTLALGGRHVIKHAMVSLPRPPGWTDIRDVSQANGRLTLTEAGGQQIDVAFDAGFFAP